ncbi:hypothetical protein M885DRAFT_618850 [Pelagophyceae sp. CCMP2097]|nr:hypothetical protein M885DRAFT_618850 [Pelagophyceae sp. CCMP2097]
MGLGEALEALDRGGSHVAGVLTSLRTQGFALRELVDAHRRAVARCCARPREGHALSGVVCRASQAIVRRAVGHVAVCAGVKRDAADFTGAEAAAPRTRRLLAGVLNAAADDELQRTVRCVLWWFAETICEAPLGRVRAQLETTAALLRWVDGGMEKGAPPTRSAADRGAPRPRQSAGGASAELAAARRSAERPQSRAKPGAAATPADDAAASAAAAADHRASLARLDLALALGKAAFHDGAPRAEQLAWLVSLAAPRPFEAPGLPDDALCLVLSAVAEDGDVTGFARLAGVSRRFRDLTRRIGAAALAAAGATLRYMEEGRYDDDAKDASLAATLRWLGDARPLTVRIVGRPAGDALELEALCDASRRCDGTGLRHPHASLAAVFSMGAPRLRDLVCFKVVDVGGFDDGAAAAVAAGCEVLQSVVLRGTGVGDAGVAALAAGLRCTLRHLVVADTRRRPVVSDTVAYAAHQNGTGPRPSLGDVGVAALARVCAPNASNPRRGTLTTLAFERQARLTDEGVLAAASGLGAGLVNLSFAGCHGLSDLAPVAIADACPRLQSLSLADCSGVSDVGALALSRHGALRHVSLAGTRCTAVGISAIIEHCQSLAALWPRADAACRRKAYACAHAGTDEALRPLADVSVLRDICLRRFAFEAATFDRAEIRRVTLLDRAVRLRGGAAPAEAPEEADGALEDIVFDSRRPPGALRRTSLVPRWSSPAFCTLVLDSDHAPLSSRAPGERARPAALLRPGCALCRVDGACVAGFPSLENARAAAKGAVQKGAVLEFAALSVLQIAFAMLVDAVEDGADGAEAALDDARLVRCLLDRARYARDGRQPDSVPDSVPWCYAAVGVVAALLRRAITAHARSTNRREFLHALRSHPSLRSHRFALRSRRQRTAGPADTFPS